jgi:hypothetical protein
MSQWWDSKNDAVADEAFAWAKAIRENYSHHYDDLLRAFRLYGNFEAAGLAVGNYSKPVLGKRNFLTINLVKSCVDTVWAQMAKSIPRPCFQTDGGSWAQQKKAKRLDKFCSGIFWQTKYPRIARMCFRDAEIFGKGCAKFYEDSRKRVRIERIFPDEILVDPMEAVYGEPTQIGQVRSVSRAKLRAKFKDDERVLKALDAAPATPFGQFPNQNADRADLVQVLETWHLPSGIPPEVASDESDPEALMEGHDGRHALSIDGTLLHVEAWRDEFFPFSFLEVDPAVLGFWPKGYPIQLRGIQYELNQSLRQVQESIPWCVPKAFVPAASKVVLAHLDDIAGGIIRFSGPQAPVIQAIAAVAPQLFEHIDRLIRQGYEMIGVSQLAAAQRKPEGLQSGKAIREYRDSGTERHAIPGVGLEDFVVDSALQVIRLARKIAARDGDYTVNAPVNRRMTQKVKWSEVDLTEDDFITEVFPISALPRDPAARLDMVQDFVNLGLLDKEDVPRLLMFPDLEAVNELNEASAEFTNMQIEAMVERGEAQSPEPYQNLAYALKHAQSSYLAAKTQEDIPESHLQLVREYIQQCAEMMKAKTPPPAPVPNAPPAPPAAPPAAAPPIA